MPTASPSLADLRRRIDELDDALQDVLIARANVVESVARLKQREATPPIRPGREAQIIRRLLARHRGAFPKPMLVRLLRELLAGTIALQLDVQVAVYAPENGAGLWDLARDHYGSHAAMSGFRSTGEVVRAVGIGRATVGILPALGQGNGGQGNGDAWWRFLAASDAAALHVIARLPFGARGNARGEADAFVIAALEPEESGEDRSLYLIETGEGLSRTKLLNALGAVGPTPTVLAASAPEAGAVAQLVEFDGWVAPGDAQLKDALGSLGNKRVVWLGAYARPLGTADLAPAPGPSRVGMGR